ncbi:MAG: DUF2179 domain-containing protein [Phycisphaerales bacterium]
MTIEVLLISLGIVGARILDVTLGTLRTVAVIHGRRGAAFLLGFVEVLIWVLVVSGVISTVKENPWYAIAYALGFATGNYLGITLEGRFAFGKQVVRVFTRHGAEIASTLRAEKVPVTEFDGRGKDGPISMLFIELGRRDASRMLAKIRELDPHCYYVVDDIRLASLAGPASQSSDANSPVKRK